jgi:hypothetical protein
MTLTLRPCALHAGAEHRNPYHRKRPTLVKVKWFTIFVRRQKHTGGNQTVMSQQIPIPFLQVVNLRIRKRMAQAEFRAIQNL